MHNQIYKSEPENLRIAYLVYSIILYVKRKENSMVKNSSRPLYRTIVDYFKKKIDENELLLNDKLPTEVELANMFNVSRITSKKAMEELEKLNLIYRIQGSGSYVASTLENNINNKDCKMDGLKKPKSIAMILPFESSNGRIIDAVKGATEGFNEKNYYLSLHSTDRNTDREGEILNNLYQNGIDGIIYYPINDNMNYDVVFMLKAYNFPIVTIDKYFDSLQINYVVSDNFKGSYDATCNLIKLGHKKVAYVSDIDIETASSVRNRYFGYVQALVDNNIPINNNLIKLNFTEVGDRILQRNNEIVDERYSQVIEQVIKDLLVKGVTAIVAINDYVAINIISSCKYLGINVPEKISVVGFDNLELTNFISVPLTTIEQNFYEMGKAAAEILIDRIENGNSEYVQKIIPTQFIDRKSCEQIGFNEI